MAEYTYICKATETTVIKTPPMVPTGDYVLESAVYDALYKFEKLPDIVEKQVIKSIEFIGYAANFSYTAVSLDTWESVDVHFGMDRVGGDWDVATNTQEDYYKLPKTDAGQERKYYGLLSYFPETDYADVGEFQIPLWSKTYPDYGLALKIRESDYSLGTGHYTAVKANGVTSARSANVPYLKVICEDSVPVVTPLTPTNIYVDVTQPIGFVWSYRDPAGNPQSTYEIRLRALGDTEWTTIATGTGTSILHTIPANSIEVRDTWQWQVVVTSDQGIQGVSSIGSFMARPVPSATILRPNGGFVDASTDTLFEWDYFNPIGDAQAGYTIELSTNGVDWETLATAETSETSFTAPPNTLNYNITQWRLWVTNQQGVQSETPAVAAIKVIAAPGCEIIAASRTPRPTIEWKATEQTGYQVQIGSHDSGAVYGTASSYKCPVYLPDGPTQVRVRVVNQYGLWSQWAATTVNIANAPGTPALLTATATHRAALSWSGPEGAYTVLRDEREIAQVQGSAYVDELAIGRHTYQVRHALAGDYYTLSNEISVDMRCPYPMIAALDSLDWLALKLSTTATPAAGISRSQEVYYTHYSGRRLPLAETSGYTNVTLSFSAAFRSPAEAEGLLSLVGKAVCYKDPRGQLIIGVLEGLESEVGRMYSEYTGVIRATDEGAGL